MEKLLERALAIKVGWGEFVTLAALFVCAGGVFAAVEIVEEALEGDTNVFDETVLLALRSGADLSDPIGPRWVEVVFTDITSLGGYPLLTLIGLLVAGYLALIRNWRMLAIVAVSMLGATLLSVMLKGHFDRPRPELVAHLVEVETASLPSGHAMLSAVTYLTLGALLAQVQQLRAAKVYIVAVAIFITLLVGISRVYLGVHWPTDVLAGWSIGAAWAMACWLIARILISWRGKSESTEAKKPPVTP